MPFAPGTFGTLCALLLVALLDLSAPTYLAVTVIFVLVGTAAAGEAERAIGRKDPECVVVDEVAGFFFAAAFLPQTPAYLFSAFILFRFFDILKPTPIKRLQGLKGGLGIMADDVAAGVLANVVLQLCRVLI
jgi:phosphatidylglycerophosphatase A